MPDKISLQCKANTDMTQIEQILRDFGKIETFAITPHKLEDFWSFRWNPLKKGSQLTLSDDNTKVTKTASGKFHTVIGDKPLIPARTYKWHLKVIQGSNFKIGVCKEISEFENQSFSDTQSGWAWNNQLAQLRHNSTNEGQSYSSKLSLEDMLTV